MFKPVTLIFIFVSIMTSCAQTSENLAPKESYLAAQGNAEATAAGKPTTDASEQSELGDVGVQGSAVRILKPLAFKMQVQTSEDEVANKFSANKMVKIAADELKLNNFLHYVMGEVLGVSYILGQEIKDDDSTLTLNLQQSVSQQKLYSLVEQLLAERQYLMRYNDGIYYISKEDNSQGKRNIAFGYGNQVKDVPETSQEIWQMAPFDYGFNGSLQLTLSQLAKVQVFPDSQQNLLQIRGKRAQIIKALEFMQLVDRPKFGQRQVAIYKTVYVDIKSLTTSLVDLLGQEGITVGTANNVISAVSIVPLPNIGAITLFAKKESVIERVLFWAKTLDQPAEGNNIQYFIYQPQFSRASDLGLSLQALIGGGQATGNSTSLEAENNKIKQRVSSSGISNSNIGLVIDERANSLIFQSTGEEYRKLLPLIRRLDIMPKQIMLEVMIAEVVLTDEFKQGVDFSLTNQGDASVIGGFTLDSGSGGLSYALSGVRGSLNIDLFQKNDNVNVLSRPSLLVRDGVTAEITVGNDIPTVGEIITDGLNGNQTSVVYRKTGVELTVTPTINAQGVVIMEILQKTSNQASAGSSVEGAPIIFERSIKTEVVAESGQTIILGGLMSENRTINDTSVPGFSSIPLLGQLFDSKEDTTIKTELVVMVTPRVIESNDEWQDIKQRLASELNSIELP
ncbi:MAG: general secretion pathway protein D [Colwellia sp.]|jgi:general secretion pathway protein D